MTTTTAPNYHRILARLDSLQAAKTVKPNPDENPFAHQDIDMVAGDSDYPAINMAAKAPDSTVAYEMEAARFAAKEKGRVDKSARRMAEAKARAERKVEFDRIAAIKTQPSQERLDRAWLVVLHLVRIVTQVAKSKQRWANRLLGSSADDVPQMALEHMAMVLAKQTTFDLDVLVIAAEQLGKFANGIPGDQVFKDSDPESVKQVKKARKWLMGMVNNRVMGALVDTYTTQRNLKWDNLDIITTVMASINGPGDDPMLNNFKASRAPAFLGTRFQAPDGIDGNALAMALAGAITDRGLDPLVEFLLTDDPENPVRRTDGLVHWSQHAEAIFKLAPAGDGEWMWDLVVRSTEGLNDPRRARGVAARTWVRSQFEFMPGLIYSIVDAFDHHAVGRASHNHYRAVLASPFAEYLPVPGEVRTPLVPALKFASPAEAARVLTEYLARLSTADDLINSVSNA